MPSLGRESGEAPLQGTAGAGSGQDKLCWGCECSMGSPREGQRRFPACVDVTRRQVMWFHPRGLCRSLGRCQGLRLLSGLYGLRCHRSAIPQRFKRPHYHLPVSVQRKSFRSDVSHIERLPRAEILREILARTVQTFPRTRLGKNAALTHLKKKPNNQPTFSNPTLRNLPTLPCPGEQPRAGQEVVGALSPPQVPERRKIQ